ncbi:hypothetical protein B0H17DRAFT_1190291 [Mycena rosella]|uniref:Uncharacterized protein n=1 Tax=Mycena rosella TaxID=1033263 RepID=A0AAD7H271_MYCRO|nr:hypothetical protein B0H17DRAFT_1190291 [Mycena rosella]
MIWIHSASTPAACALLREKGVHPRSCRAIWLHLLLLNRAHGLNKPCAPVWQREHVANIRSLFPTAYIEIS